MLSRLLPPRRRKRVRAGAALFRKQDGTSDRGSPDQHWHRFLTEFLPHVVWTATADGSCDFCNFQWTALTGLSRESTYGSGWTAALHPEEEQRVLNWWAGCLAGRNREEIRYRLRSAADNGYRWHLGRVMPVHGNTGKIVKWIGTAVDIHDQVHAENELQSSDAKYRNVVEMSQDAIYVRIGDRIVFANAATARIFGVTLPEEVIGCSPMDNVHTDYAEALRQRWHQLVTDGAALPPFEFKIARPDGRHIDVESLASPIEYQGMAAALVVVRDISARKALERQQMDLLREQSLHAQAAASAERFKLLAESVPDMVWTAQADGYIDYANGRVLRYLNCSFGDIEGWGWGTIIHPDDLPLCLEHWNRSLAAGSEYEVEFRIRRGADNSYRWHIARAQPVRDEKGNIVKWVGTATDIDDQKTAQEILSSSRAQLEAAVQLRTRELLAANAALQAEIAERMQIEDALRGSEEKLRKLSAHLQSARETERTAIAREIHDELSSSLTAVKMDLVRHNKLFGQSQPESRDLLAGMVSLVDSAIETVRRIATRLRPSILDHLGLWPALEWQLGEFENRYGIRCSVSFESTPDNLDKDMQTALFRIIQEALTNVARHAGASRVQLGVLENGGHVEISFSDNGVGIPPARVTDPGSCGIQGMLERARAFGGNIRFESIPSEGTRLTIRLPLRQNHVSMETETADHHAAHPDR